MKLRSESHNSKASSTPSPSPKSSSSPNKYLRPGALAKLRDSKVSARRWADRISLSVTPLSPPTSPTHELDQLPLINQDNGIPCFALTVNRPRCLGRKKLFAVTPFFTPIIDDDAAQHF